MDFSSKSLLPPICNRAEFSPPSLGDFRFKFCSVFKALRLGPARCWTPSICVNTLPTGSAQCVPSLGPCHTTGQSNSPCSYMFPFNNSHWKGCNTVRLAQHLQAKTCFTLIVLSRGKMASPHSHSAASHSSGTLWLPGTTINRCNTKCQGMYF